MKISKYISSLIIAAVGLMVLAAQFDDAAIKACLAKSVRYMHSEMTDYAQESAFVGCNNDTNRFIRLVKEVAQENANAAGSMLLLIGKYGSTNDLDFISNYLRDDKAGRRAASAYFDISGFTSNSISASIEFMSETSSASMDKKTSEMNNLIRRFTRDGVPDSLRSYAYAAALDFAVNATNNICDIDRRILPFYPSYSNSLVRLTILTNAVARGVNEYELRYLTNAIHHIELP